MKCIYNYYSYFGISESLLMDVVYVFYVFEFARCRQNYIKDKFAQGCTKVGGNTEAPTRETASGKTASGKTAKRKLNFWGYWRLCFPALAAGAEPYITLRRY